MSLFCGLCLPLKILLMEYSKNTDQLETSVVILCWIFQLSQQTGFVIVDISLLLVTLSRYLYVYKTHLVSMFETFSFS
jgi:hypothetical protein